MAGPAAVKRPTAEILDVADVFKNGLPDCNRLRAHFEAEGRLSAEAASKIVRNCTKILGREETLLQVKGPVVIVGDIHGQFFDLLRVLELGGEVTSTRYLFLGDYVDRGYFSIECVLYLWALKINYPSNILLLRGNHECRHLTEYFTFELECEAKYTCDLYEDCIASFECLPLAAVIDQQYLCVHGGMSPEICTLEDIAAIDRFQEPPAEGPMCDLLWSDPIKSFSATSDDNADAFFKENSARGCAFYFTYQATCRFLERNGLLCLIRAHEVQDAGFRIYDPHYSTGFPSMICVFSAPNYLDVYGNKGAILKMENGALNVKQFVHSTHPYWLPNFMNVFTWSLPFIGEKVTEMLKKVIEMPAEEEPRVGAASATQLPPVNRGPGTVSARRDVIRRKIRAIGRMAQYFQVLREEHEEVVRLKGLYPSGQLPVGMLESGADGIKAALMTFDKARVADAANEKLPPRVAKNEKLRRRDDVSEKTATEPRPPDTLSMSTDDLSELDSAIRRLERQAAKGGS